MFAEFQLRIVYIVPIRGKLEPTTKKKNETDIRKMTRNSEVFCTAELIAQLRISGNLQSLGVFAILNRIYSFKHLF